MQGTSGQAKRSSNFKKNLENIWGNPKLYVIGLSGYATLSPDADMVLNIIIFLGVILALTIGAHLLLYRALRRLYVITSPAIRAVLLTSLLLLSLCFMASFFLLKWQENPVTIGFYMFSAIWTGLLIHLLLAMALSWLIIAVAWMAGSHPNTKIIASACLSLAVLFTAYGVWNAFHPRITHVEVAFDNLPAHWKNKTLVQLSDVHLGHFYGEHFLAKLVKNVNALNPEVIFITGDLFDGMASDISHFAVGLKQFKANRGVFFVTGNHETYVGLQRALTSLKQTNIQILQNEAIEIDGLGVIGIAFPGLKKTEDIQGLDSLQRSSNDTQPLILLFHTPTNASPRVGDRLDRHFSTYWVPDTSFTLPKLLGVNMQLSGHTHAGQVFPFGYLTNLIYKGYDYGLQRSDNFTIYTTSGVGTWGPPLRTGNSPEIVAIKIR